MTTAIVLAGGLGTRLRSAVPDLPKPMAPVRGRPFLAHLLDGWIGQGVDQVVLSVGYRHEAISGHFGRAYRGVPIDYAVETEPAGTGGALLLAASHLRDGDRPALLLNGDTWFDVPLAALLARARALDADWCFSLFRNPDPARYMGVGLDADGLITTWRDPAAPHANGGVYLFRPSSLAGVAFEPGRVVSLENDLFPRFLAAGQRFAGLPADGAFIDIGIPDDWRRAGEVLRASPDDPAN